MRDGVGVVTRRTRGALGIRLQDDNDVNGNANDPTLAENNLYVDDAGYLEIRYPNRSHSQKKKSDTTKTTDNNDTENSETNTTTKDPTISDNSSVNNSAISNGDEIADGTSGQIQQNVKDTSEQNISGTTEKIESNIPSSNVKTNLETENDSLITKGNVPNEDHENATTVKEVSPIESPNSEIRKEPDNPVENSQEKNNNAAVQETQLNPPHEVRNGKTEPTSVSESQREFVSNNITSEASQSQDSTFQVTSQGTLLDEE